jgi:hypothetical protein
VESFSRWKRLEAVLKVESAELEASAEGFRKDFPVNSFDCVVTPTEALMHVFLEKSKAVLTLNSGGKSASNAMAAYGELDLGCW